MDKHKTHIFSQEELDNIAGLGEVLLKIHRRLLSEGKIKVENGKTIFLENIKTDASKQK